MRATWALAVLLISGSCADKSGIQAIERAICNCDRDPPPCCCSSPIVIDVAGDGVRLTSPEDGVLFALRPDLTPQLRAWTAAESDDSWLVLDRDGNGFVNDGSELFGDITPQPDPPFGEERNGFIALLQYDDNGDHVIDARDDVFAHLQLWQDRNHDGFSQSTELQWVHTLGILGISLSYVEDRQVDEHHNLFRFRTSLSIASDSRIGMTAWDVWLASTSAAPAVSHNFMAKPDVPCNDTERSACMLAQNGCWSIVVGGTQKCYNGNFVTGNTGKLGNVNAIGDCSISGQAPRACTLQTVQCCPDEGCSVPSE